MIKKIRDFRQKIIDDLNGADIDIEIKRLVLDEILSMVTKKCEEVLNDELHKGELAEQAKHGNTDKCD